MGENGSKIKISSDLLGDCHTSQFKGAVYVFDIDMSRFCQDVKKSIFRQIGPKFKALPDSLKSLHSRNVEGV